MRLRDLRFYCGELETEGQRDLNLVFHVVCECLRAEIGSEYNCPRTWINIETSVDEKEWIFGHDSKEGPCSIVIGKSKFAPKHGDTKEVFCDNILNALIAGFEILSEKCSLNQQIVIDAARRVRDNHYRFSHTLLKEKSNRNKTLRAKVIYEYKTESYNERYHIYTDIILLIDNEILLSTDKVLLATLNEVYSYNIFKGTIKWVSNNELTVYSKEKKVVFDYDCESKNLAISFSEPIIQNFFESITHRDPNKHFEYMMSRFPSNFQTTIRNQIQR